MEYCKGRLSIVIPTYNEATDLGDCLNSICKQNIKKNLIEVIVVDNYSTDETISICKKYLKRVNLKIVMNRIKDAEVSKKKGFDLSTGEFFMYLDADMRFKDKDFIEKMLFPFSDDPEIAGNFVKFVVNRGHPPLTRALSYDFFQRDPVLKFFTIGIEKIVTEKRPYYWLCKCDKNKIPPQGLMIYKKKLIENYVKNEYQLIDNEIPAILVELGFEKFAFVPYVGVEHLLLRNLTELWKKRVRNLQRTYYPNIKKRKFKWINWKKDWVKVGIWILYLHSPLVIINSIIKIIKNRDFCFLSEPALNVVSTYAIIFEVLKNGK